MSSQEQNGEEYEQEHVHSVYEQIASHFSSTRYKVGAFRVCDSVALSSIDM